MAIIGIELGTSNSAAAVLRGGRSVIVPGPERISLVGKDLCEPERSRSPTRCSVRPANCRL